MNSKKILVIRNSFFNLPDDFSGTWRDAVQLFADYVKEEKKNTKIIMKNDLTFNEAFFELFNDDESRHISAINVQELINGKWVNK